MVKKLGLFENEELKKAEVTKLLKSTITEKSFQPIIDSAMEFCYDQAEVKLKQFEKQSKNVGADENVCSPLPMIFFNCLKTRLVVVSVLKHFVWIIFEKWDKVFSDFPGFSRFWKWNLRNIFCRSF